MDRNELKLTVENNKHGFIDMGVFPLIEISSDDMCLLKNRYPFAWDFLQKFGCTGISKKIDMNMYQYFTVNNHFRKEYLISDSEINIAQLQCGAQKKNVSFSNECHCFKIDGRHIIAHSTEDLFGYMLSDESILSINILPETFEKLKSFGWYEGRSIDVSNIIEKFEADGTPLSEKQKSFLQEFSGIKGIDANDEEFIIYDRIRMPKWRCDSIVYHTAKVPSQDDMYSYGPLNLVAYNNNTDMLCVGESGNGIMPIWVSTEGKLFRDDGAQLGRTIFEGLQTVLLH